MHYFEVFSKPGCSYCVQAKAMLDAHGFSYSEKHLDVGQNKIEGVEYVSRDVLLENFPGAKTLPQIRYKYVNSSSEPWQYVGGYTNLGPWIKELKSALSL